MNAISPLFHQSIDETAAEQRDRHRSYTYELAELNMQAARIAAHDIAEQQFSGTRAPTAADPSLSLARATRGVAVAVNLERRICGLDAASARAPAQRPTPDPRRAPLQRALHPIAKAQPDPACRAALHHDITDGIETALRDDPDGEIPLPILFDKIVRDLDLHVDYAKLPDEILGMPPRPTHPPDEPPGPPPTNENPVPPF